MMAKDWFAAHKDGLRQVAERLVERRGFGIVGAELYQNVMDTSATECIINVDLMPGRPVAELSVIDNGPGYTDLSHAWTVYAPSEKKSDPTKAGRFNVGCKVALSFCRKARVHTTSGTVEFDGEGRHEYPRRKRESGTEFWAEIDITRPRYEELLQYMQKIIVRPGLTLTVNRKPIFPRHPMHIFETTLQTEIGDELRKSNRKTEVQIFEVPEGETAMLYELGIPVVGTDDKWHYNVMQKVPLNVDRDNVTPGYLKSVRTFVFNELHTEITKDETTDSWVNEAAGDERCTEEATSSFMDKKFGEKRVAFDGNNPDANAAALTAGYQIIPPRGLTPGQRANAKETGALHSSSVAFPNAGRGAYSNNPDAEPVQKIPKEKWTPAMELIHEYTTDLGWKLLDDNVCVEFVLCKKFVGKRWAACFFSGRESLGGSLFHYNKFVLGNRFFENGFTDKLDALIIHEFAHYYVGNHATDEFHDACCDLGARLAHLAIENPRFFRNFRRKFAERTK